MFVLFFLLCLLFNCGYWVSVVFMFFGFVVLIYLVVVCLVVLVFSGSLVGVMVLLSVCSVGIIVFRCVFCLMISLFLLKNSIGLVSVFCVDKF